MSHAFMALPQSHTPARQCFSGLLSNHPRVFGDISEAVSNKTNAANWKQDKSAAWDIRDFNVIIFKVFTNLGASVWLNGRMLAEKVQDPECNSQHGKQGGGGTSFKTSHEREKPKS